VKQIYAEPDSADFVQPAPRETRHEAPHAPDRPALAEAAAPAPARSTWARLLRRPVFVAVVLIPNLLSLLYFGLVAAPVYVSTASLVVLNPQKSGPSLSSMLSGASGDSSEQGGYLLKDYLGSWQAFTNVEKPLGVDAHFRQGDPVSRYGGLTTLFRDNDVALWRYLQSRIGVEIDQKSGIVSMDVMGYSPDFALKLANAMLADAIAHLDAMNAEQARDYVSGAIARRTRIETALQEDLAALARFRTTSGSYDPRALYESNLSLLNSLSLKEADLKSQRDAIAAATPNNPVARNLGSQMSSVRGNIAAARQVFPDIAQNSARYERLVVSRDNNISLLAQANMSVQSAQLTAEKNRYYLNVISRPSAPQTPEEPRRLLWIAGIMLCSMLLWGVLR
jgi:capsular polysaccharide transport system permease protein